jgi:uncharacterized membrane protein
VSEPATRERLTVVDLATIAVGFVLGTFAYRIVVEVLLGTDAVHREPGYDDAALRDALLRLGPWVLLVAGIAVFLVSVRRDRARPPALALVGGLLVGGGAALFAWGAVDMHGLGLYDWRTGTPAGLLDLVYHGGGVLVAAVGWALLTFDRARAS